MRFDHTTRRTHNTDIDRTSVHVRFATAKQSQGRHAYITYGKRDLQLCSRPSLSSLTYPRHRPKHVNAGTRILHRQKAAGITHTAQRCTYIKLTHTHLRHKNSTITCSERRRGPGFLTLFLALVKPGRKFTHTHNDSRKVPNRDFHMLVSFVCKMRTVEYHYGYLTIY